MNRAERISHFRSECNGLFLPFYDALWAQAPKEFAPYSVRRGIMEQDVIFNEGRDLNGKIVDKKKIKTYARGGESAHNYGCAVDATIFSEDGTPTWLRSDDERWAPFGQIVKQIGLKWGGDFSNISDPGHSELKLSITWRDVYNIYKSNGIAVAFAFIEDSQIT